MAATAFAGESSLRPESSIPTPAARSEISQEVPSLGAKESQDWQRLREERRQAREQILSHLRASSTAEKRSIRQEVSKGQPRPHLEGEIPNNTRERQPNADLKEQKPQPPSNPWRDYPYGPRPFPGDPFPR